MHQQINLFQPVFRKQQKVFSAVTLLQICGAVGALLLMVAGHARWQLADMRQDAATLNLQLGELSQQIGVLETTYRTPDSAALDAEIHSLQRTIEQRHHLLQQFDRLVLQHRGGFSAQFSALAEVNLPGLWLEGVAISEDKHIEIRGIALDPRLIPRYLQLLEERTALAGTAFETVSMTRLDTDRPHIQFVLRNVEAPKS